ncbi:hypothetical protein PM082_024601 [Marasmius tenuissimus]|nr:hypothetical protein PM082_024601 [Marasmius tenuissimus]
MTLSSALRRLTGPPRSISRLTCMVIFGQSHHQSSSPSDPDRILIGSLVSDEANDTGPKMKKKAADIVEEKALDIILGPRTTSLDTINNRDVATIVEPIAHPAVG